jgi:hypothetical protein
MPSWQSVGDTFSHRVSIRVSHQLSLTALEASSDDKPSSREPAPLKGAKANSTVPAFSRNRRLQIALDCHSPATKVHNQGLHRAAPAAARGLWQETRSSSRSTEGQQLKQTTTQTCQLGIAGSIRPHHLHAEFCAVLLFPRSCIFESFFNAHYLYVSNARRLFSYDSHRCPSQSVQPLGESAANLKINERSIAAPYVLSAQAASTLAKGQPMHPWPTCGPPARATSLGRHLKQLRNTCLVQQWEVPVRCQGPHNLLSVWLHGVVSLPHRFCMLQTGKTVRPA